jgi:hypothetical protein
MAAIGARHLQQRAFTAMRRGVDEIRTYRLVKVNACVPMDGACAM